MRERLADIARLAPVALVMFLVSEVLWDLYAGRPPFWSSREAALSLLWSACIIVPFMLFALAVAQQRQKQGSR